MAAAAVNPLSASLVFTLWCSVACFWRFVALLPCPNNNTMYMRFALSLSRAYREAHTAFFNDFFAKICFFDKVFYCFSSSCPRVFLEAIRITRSDSIS